MKLTMVPRASCTFAHTFEIKHAPLSLTAESQRPKVLTHDLMKALAHWSAVACGMGTASTHLDVLSSIVSI